MTAVTIDTLTLTYTPDKIESAGVYTFPDANDADGAWVLGSSTYMTGSDTIVTTAVALSTTHTEATSLNQSGDNYLMLLPQATEEGDLRVGIKYSVAEQGKEAQKYECTTLLPALVWEQGKQHTYTFRLMRNEVFIVTKVSAWDEGKGAGAPIYKELGVFSNAAGSGESSAIDWLAYNSANAGDNAVLFIQLPKETKTETVSFDAETDVGLAGVILTHTGSNPNDWTSAGNVTIDGGGRTIDLQGLPAGSPLVTVGEGVTLTLQHIAFKGLDSSDDDDAADNNSCLFLVDGGTLILGEGASITKNVSSGSSGDCIADAAGGVVVKAGTLAMLEGSAISNNTGQMGGGVAMRGTTGGAFTMEGGSIANNTATYAGGVYVEKYNNHTFTREGGTVSGNTNGKDWSDVGQVENAGTFSVYHLNLTSKIPVPVPGAQPPTFFSDCQYTGTVAWEMSDGQTHTGAFKASGGYKAKVTLAAASGYTFSGLAANSFTHNYTTDVTHAQGGEGDLTVTIPFYLDVSQGVSGANWTYSNSTFTITHSGDYVVTGTTTTNRVAVAQGVTANITTNNVSIDVSDVSNAVAFDIAAGARVELVLAGINTLKSNVSAGLHVPQGAELTITAVTSADSLLAVGGHSTIGGGAGIGGNSG